VPAVDVTLATLAQQPGGVWRHLSDLAAGLAERGVGVRVALPDAAADLHARAARQGLDVVSLSATGGDIWHVHLHDTLDVRAAAALGRRRLGREATVATEHLPRTNASDRTLLPGHRRSPGAQTAKLMFKRAELRLTGATITVSHAAKAFMLDRYGRAAETVVVVPNGIAAPPAATDPPDREPGAMAVVAVGALIMQKGMDVLIEASVGASGWHVRIVGDGPHLDQLRGHAATTGASAELIGWSEEPMAEIRAADVFCLPSRWESFGYVVLEAMAIGRPVVGSDVDAVPELVQDGVTGVLVPAEDPAALRAALDALAADPARRRALGQAATVRARDGFGVDRMVDATIAVYEQALRRRRTRG
jgi:glycosyltransferase involved in cell wall biosynthesis